METTTTTTTTQLRIASEDEDQRAMTRRFAFSRERLNAVRVPPGAKRTFVYDTKLPGLCFQKMDSGATAFLVYKRVRAGRPVRFKLGGGDLTVEQARQLALEP